ncbi:MAG: DUF2027 domain-containing protein [Muribaculaceae bacterium]|nr:DUF2027 domain-containing protein [Muribaculaceae bacterium]
MAKIGDTVRFLNDIGGGVIVRIDGRTAYVRDPDDGFETPMLLTECVVVPSASADTPSPAAAQKADRPAPSEIIKKYDSPQRPARPDRPLTAALIFEPHDIRRLSQTGFDLYLVNDSNFRLAYAVASRDADEGDWTLIGAGEAEPDMQVFLGEKAQCDLNSLGRLSIQLLAYKSEGRFELQQPVDFNTRLDLTRLAKLHCFTQTAYSDVAVLTVPVVTNGEVVRPANLRPLIESYLPAKPKPEPVAPKPAATPKSRKQESQVVDLHIDMLLDSTAGLQPADMLACQLREFDRCMEQGAKTPGKKIIFIHGKGEGVLRAALLDRLRRRWPRCEVQDASFREYGFGATQVTIHR